MEIKDHEVIHGFTRDFTAKEHRVIWAARPVGYILVHILTERLFKRVMAHTDPASAILGTTHDRPDRIPALEQIITVHRAERDAAREQVKQVNAELVEMSQDRSRWMNRFTRVNSELRTVKAAFDTERELYQSAQRGSV